MEADPDRVAQLEELWREFSEECMALRERAGRIEAGRKVVLRALAEGPRRTSNWQRPTSGDLASPVLGAWRGIARASSGNQGKITKHILAAAALSLLASGALWPAKTKCWHLPVSDAGSAAPFEY